MSVAEVETNNDLKAAVTRAASISVEQVQPKPLCALLPSSTETCTVYGVSQSFGKSQDSLKSTTVHTEPDGDGKDTNRSSDKSLISGVKNSNQLLRFLR